ncbi:MAG: DNA-binding protein WhiA [Lachnospiraceae bacterium]|nr:DNA-binding protein WhiA [Lachnospiraceae bacterium]
MSFSGEVKEELMKHVSSSRHCQLAELAAIIHFCGEVVETDGFRQLFLQTENGLLVRKCFTLCKKTFNIEACSVSDGKENGVRTKNGVLILEAQENVEKVFLALKAEAAYEMKETLRLQTNTMLLKNSCCRRAFLRGAFLSVGSMSDPEKSYHMEFACEAESQAEQLRDLILDFEVEAKIIPRKKHFVVYIKEGAAIVDILNIMEAPVALMNMENLRIVKEVRNSVNRRVNCEAANITKTVNASSKQVEDILLIKEHHGLQNLPDGLREMAEIRLEYPEATLKELGQYLNPEVGKSGVNHRLRKLSEIADAIRS